MSDIYLARTNQKLSFVRLHLDALSQAHNSNSWNKHGLIESYNESVLFHLKGALEAFIREVGERYDLALEAIHTPVELQSQLEATGQESPELNELVLLAGQPNGWLAKLERAYAACWQASDKQAGPQQGQSVSEIHVVQINPDHAQDADLLAEYRDWFAELNRLIERLRAGMQEW
ncbi:DUF6586 family protein [Marinobacterium litorale]|uniref:DUF6586 family protein n=1 Tax=Marinobacterium litorale TaxID=404770 RepID=UPI00041F8F2B|nr:DUF6586 family protein [Marinobacterium litorale]